MKQIIAFDTDNVDSIDDAIAMLGELKLTSSAAQSVNGAIELCRAKVTSGPSAGKMCCRQVNCPNGTCKMHRNIPRDQWFDAEVNSSPRVQSSSQSKMSPRANSSPPANSPQVNKARFCPSILKSGLRTGQVCNNPSVNDNGTCGTHRRAVDQ